MDFLNNLIFIGTDYGDIEVFNIHLGKLAYRLLEHRERILSLKYNDGILISTSNDGRIKMWDLDSQSVLNSIRVSYGQIYGHDMPRRRTYLEYVPNKFKIIW